MNNLVTNLNKQEKRFDDFDPKSKQKEEFSYEQLKQQVINIANIVDKHEKRVPHDERLSKQEQVSYSNVSTAVTEKNEVKQVNIKNSGSGPDKKIEQKKNICKVELPETKSKPNQLKKEDEK